MNRQAAKGSSETAERMRYPRWFLALSAVGLACSGNASLGNDHRPTSNAGAAGTSVASTGGSSGRAAAADSGGSGASTAGGVGKGGGSSGSSAHSAGTGGQAAVAGSGGSSTSSAGMGGAGGMSSGSGGSNAGTGSPSAGEGGMGAPGGMAGDGIGGGGGAGAGGAGGGAGGVGGATLTDCSGLVCGAYQQSVKVLSPALGQTQCACVPFPGANACEDCTCGAALCSQFFATCIGFSLEGGLGCTQNG